MSPSLDHSSSKQPLKFCINIENSVKREMSGRVFTFFKMNFQNTSQVTYLGRTTRNESCCFRNVTARVRPAPVKRNALSVLPASLDRCCYDDKRGFSAPSPLGGWR